MTVGKLPHSPSQISSLAAALGPVEDVLPAITFQHGFMRGSLMVVTTYVSKFHNFIFDGRFAPFAFFRQVPQYVHTRHTQIFIEYWFPTLLYCRSRPTFRAFTDLRLWVWSVFRFYLFLTARLPILRNPVGSLAGSFLPSVPLPPRPNEKTYAHLCSTPRFLELFSNPFFHLSHLKVFPKPAFYIFGVA